MVFPMRAYGRLGRLGVPDSCARLPPMHSSLCSKYILLLYILLLSVSAAHGALVIDDFDDPVRVVVPEMENEPATTSGVGILNAFRTIQVTSSQTDPIGFSDVNLSSPSTWTTRIDQQTNLGTGPSISFGVRYDFDAPVDLTEGGRNDAVFIDFGRFLAPSYAFGPWFISAGVLDGSNTFLSTIGGFGILHESAFTVAFPYESFGVRGSGGGHADFRRIERLALTIGLINGNKNPVQGWQIDIDSIRVGKIVPEPGTAGMAVLAIMCAVWRFRVNHLQGGR